MANTKYGELIKKLSFINEGPGGYRQGVKMGKDFHGQDIHIQYGTFWAAGRMGQDTYEPHVHDYDQVLLWMGADADNLLELGAEAEICLGKESERHIITSPTAVSIPRGLPHLPATTIRMDRRHIFMVFSCVPEYKATPVTTDKAPSEIAGWQSKYKNRIFRVPFKRKGAWSYGPLNPDDAGGVIASINPKDMGFDFHFNYESIRKAPYRFGPVPDRPHTHDYDEILLFMGADCNDLGELGAECEISLGKEMERHTVTTPTVVALPKGVPHCPLAVNKLHKPFVFWDISLKIASVPPM